MAHVHPQLGNTALVDKIIAEIVDKGPMTFARFMELALYDPEHGYYMSSRPNHPSSSRAETRLGWEGDFYTAPDLHPLLGTILFRQIQEIDTLLDQPTPLTVVEIGAGKGQLARDVLHACSRFDSDLSDRLLYIIVERSPMMQAAQAQALFSFAERGGRIHWATSIEELGEQAITGMIFSNELIDALPIHRVRTHEGQLKEVVVTFDGNAFTESIAELSTPELASYFERLGVSLPEGYTTEVHLEAVRSIEKIAQALHRGIVVTIDYGHTARDYYAPTRREGTLLCYSQHRVFRNPYQRIGEQDITAHVNFSALARTGEDHGLAVTGFTNLAHYLTGLGAEEILAEYPPESDELLKAAELFRPHGLGGTFKVLIQHKGLAAPALRGLRFRPFFDGVLQEREVTR